MKTIAEVVPEESSRRVRVNEKSFESGFVFDTNSNSRAALSTDRFYRVAPNATVRKPMTDTQALMEAAPFEEPEESVLHTILIKEALAAAVDAMPNDVRWGFEAHHYGQLSFREVGRQMGCSKSTAERYYRKGIGLLKAAVMERMGIDTDDV